jgi:hypothetical protein
VILASLPSALFHWQAGKDAAALKAESHMLPKQTLEVNPSHPIIVRLHKARLTQPDMARVVAEQVCSPLACREAASHYFERLPPYFSLSAPLSSLFLLSKHPGR